jgi:hypothetical protein
MLTVARESSVNPNTVSPVRLNACTVIPVKLHAVILSCASVSGEGIISAETWGKFVTNGTAYVNVYRPDAFVVP